VRRPASRAWALFLFALALLPRLYVALAWAGEPVWDGHYYDYGARRIAAGFGYSDDLAIGGAPAWHPWCHYPVGYSAFLGAFYRVFGAAPHVAAAANASVGAALAVVTWLLARNGISEARARWAGVLVAIHPGLVVYAALVMTEPLAALLTLAAFAAATSARSPRRGLVAGALLLGVGALVRPQALLCAPFLGLAVPLSPAARPDRPLARRAAHAAAYGVLACAIALVPVLPWTARNCRVMDGCALVSTNGGWNLAIGAFPRATGRFETLRSSDGCREVTGQVQQDRCWLLYGIAQIRENPARWLGLVPAKLGFTFDHESFAIEYLREARPAAWPEPRRVAARAVLSTFHRWMVAASMLGCIALVGPARERRRAAVTQAIVAATAAALLYRASGDTPSYWPLAVFVAVVPWLPLPGSPRWPAALLFPAALLATTIVTHAVFFGEDRYHVVVAPVFCIFAAAALRPPSRTPAPRHEPAGAGAA